jgi:hypothetical protein
MYLLDRVRNVLGLAPVCRKTSAWPVGFAALLVPAFIWLVSAKISRSMPDVARAEVATQSARCEEKFANPVWLPVQADSAEYQKLAGPELVLVGWITAGQGGLCRVALDNPWLPVADLGDLQRPFDKLRRQRALPQINGMKVLMKAKLKHDRSQGKYPVVVVGWLRELRLDEPDWQMPWPVNLALLPPERELFSIPMIIACQATKAADSALGYSGVHRRASRHHIVGNDGLRASKDLLSQEPLFTVLLTEIAQKVTGLFEISYRLTAWNRSRSSSSTSSGPATVWAISARKTSRQRRRRRWTATLTAPSLISRAAAASS